MIRLVVTFLVAFQAFVPPGMCVCQFVPCASTTRPAKESVPVTAVSLTVDEPCCSCAVRRAPASSPAGDRGTPDREAPPERPCPHSTPSEPWPGCPVVSGGPEARAAILPATEQVLPDAAIHFVVRTDETTLWRADRREPFFAVAASPLFVRHCALLI